MIFKYFRQKISTKWCFLIKTKLKFDHNIVFFRKNPIFRRKLAKIADICDHNIDPFCAKMIEIIGFQN
jgi:hypothetical protein